MIKYYKELDKPEDFYIPLIKSNLSNKKEILNYKIPISFYEEYSNVFDIIKYTISLAENINIEEIYKYINKYKTQYFDYPSSIENLLYEEFNYAKDKYQKINISSYDLTSMLILCKRLLSYLYDVYDNQIYHNMINQISAALEEIKKYSTIEYKEDIVKNITLPNAWYITSLGHLYNTTGGHKQTTLEYPFNGLRRDIYNNIPVNLKQYYLDELNKTIECGYIDKAQFKFYLNYKYKYVSFDKTLEKKCHDPKIMKIILGVISAHIGLFNFFENLQNYTQQPEKELEKILEITDSNFDDMLVRCAGFHKMAVCKNKLIATSSINCGEDFFEYLKRGWDVCFVPPIIINREKGIVEELNIDSPIVEKIIEEDRNKYQKIKKKEYGKIF